MFSVEVIIYKHKNQILPLLSPSFLLILFQLWGRVTDKLAVKIFPRPEDQRCNEVAGSISGDKGPFRVRFGELLVVGRCHLVGRITEKSLHL